MLEIFEDNRTFTTLILLTAMISICGHVIIGIIYQRIISETQKHPRESTGLMRLCQEEFAVAYKKYDGVVSVTGFVEKHMKTMKIGGLSLRILCSLAGQLLLVSIFIAGVLICKCLLKGDSFFYIVPLYLLSMLILYVYYSVTSFADLSGKKQALKTAMSENLRMFIVMQNQETVQKADSGVRRSEEDYKETKRQWASLREEPEMTRERTKAPRIIKRTDLVDEENDTAQTRKRTSTGDERELERLLKDFFGA